MLEQKFKKMNKKIKTIIFSKNRPNQLECLIRSLNDNSTIFNDLYILYKFTNEEYKEGYDKLKSQIYASIGERRIYFYEENEEGFKNNLNELLQLNREKYDYLCFMVDDQIMYQKLEDEDKILDSISDDVLCFSLRLGYNINYRHLTDSYFPCPMCENLMNGSFIKWNWREYGMESDFGYPFTVDGNIYKYEDILNLISPLKYTNPNTLEASLYIQINFPKNYMISYEHSKMVNLPINRVQESYKLNPMFNNKFGLKVNISEKELNDKFLNGEIIDYEKMDYSGVNSCHCELPLVFKKEYENNK